MFSLDADEVHGARATVETSAGGAVVVVVVGDVAACTVARYGDEVFVDDGLHASAWCVESRFADHSLDTAGHGPSTSVPGTITLVAVAPGDAVVVGQTLVMLEAMKMEHRILADVDGVVARVLVQQGQSVEAHTVVVEFADEEVS